MKKITLAALMLLSARSAVAQSLPAVPVSPVPSAGYEYNAEGQSTKVTVDAKSLSWSYDTLSRVSTQTDANIGLSRFGYTGRGALTSVIDPRNLATLTPRSGLGAIKSEVSPATGVKVLSTDAAGKVLTQQDARGVTATFTYDALERLTSTTYTKAGQATQVVTWTYDQTGAGFANGVGRLTSTSTPDGSTQYVYDAYGNVLSDVQRIVPGVGAPVSRTVGYTYDAANRVTTVTYPSGARLTIGYANNRPVTLGIVDGTGVTLPLVQDIQWEPFGAVKSWNWVNTTGLRAYVREYDSAGRLVRVPLGTVVRDLTYDAADRVAGYKHYDAATGTAVPAFDQTFTYDSVGRLKTVTTSAGTTTYTYDANGNRTSTSATTLNVLTIAVNSNRLVSTSSPAVTYGYNEVGSLLGDGQRVATYDGRNRLTAAGIGSANTRYGYDALNRRMMKTGPGGTVLFVYDQDNHLLGEYNSTGAVQREYVWLGDTPVAVLTPTTVGATSLSAAFIYADHLNTPRAVLSKAAALRWRWFSEPFGNAAPEENPLAQGGFSLPLRMPGQYFDAETGWFHNHHRDYDPALGRYIESDPIGLAGGLNTYNYVGNAPTLVSDPTGLDWMDRLRGVGLALNPEASVLDVPANNPDVLAGFLMARRQQHNAAPILATLEVGMGFNRAPRCTACTTSFKGVKFEWDADGSMLFARVKFPNRPDYLMSTPTRVAGERLSIDNLALWPIRKIETSKASRGEPGIPEMQAMKGGVRDYAKQMGFRELEEHYCRIGKKAGEELGGTSANHGKEVHWLYDLLNGTKTNLLPKKQP